MIILSLSLLGFVRCEQNQFLPHSILKLFCGQSKKNNCIRYCDFGMFTVLFLNKQTMPSVPQAAITRPNLASVLVNVQYSVYPEC